MIIHSSIVSGVYMIRNRVTGKMYVGSTVGKITQRWSIHKHHLRTGTHHSRHLQSSWNKHGENSFEFRVLRLCPPTSCLEFEQQYMDRYKTYNSTHGYNISPVAGSCLGIRRSEEYKKKLSESAKRRDPETVARVTEASRTPEARAKIGMTHRGKVLSQETREKISKSVREKSKEYGWKISAALRGKRLTKEHRAKLSTVRKGMRWSPEVCEARRQYALNRPPEHQAKITAGIRAAAARKRAAKFGIPTVL